MQNFYTSQSLGVRRPPLSPLNDATDYPTAKAKTVTTWPCLLVLWRWVLSTGNARSEPDCQSYTSHGLLASASRLLLATGLVNGKWQILTHYSIDTQMEGVCRKMAGDSPNTQLVTHRHILSSKKFLSAYFKLKCECVDSSYLRRVSSKLFAQFDSTVEAIFE